MPLSRRPYADAWCSCEMLDSVTKRARLAEDVCF